MPKTLRWNPKATPKELHFMLDEFGKEYSLSRASTKANLSFEKGKNPLGYTVTKDKGAYRIAYVDKSLAARAIATIFSGLADDSASYEEARPFSMLGIMIDCSRGFVPNVEYLKKWIRRLAMMGYNLLQLYTEDVYQVPGEEYFGYLRGRYSENELKALNDYGNQFGVEMMGCIQTLGHLDKILRWSTYGKVRDSHHTILAEEPESYKLIEKMIKVYQKSFSSKRICVGMDEATNHNDGVGTGQYRARHGKVDRFKLVSDHIEKVCAICKKHGLEPWIWGDIYFRLGSKHDGYADDPKSKIPAKILREIPDNARFMYWDYDKPDVSHYEFWIDRHKKLGSMPMMAAGIWTHGNTFWYYHQVSTEGLPWCVEACRKKGVDKFLVTSWSTTNAACGMDSWWAGFSYGAEHCFHAKPAKANVAKRFRAVCNREYDTYLKLSDLYTDVPFRGRGGAWYALLFDDPLQGIVWKNYHNTDRRFFAAEEKRLAKLHKIYAKLDLRHEELNYGYRIFEIMELTLKFRSAMYAAYKKKDKRALGLLAKSLPQIVTKLKQFLALSRKMWHDRHKPHGLELLQLKFGFLISRYEEARLRLLEYADKKVDSIPELDEFPKEAFGIGYYFYENYVTVAGKL